MAQAVTRRIPFSSASKLLCLLPAFGFDSECANLFAASCDRIIPDSDVFDSWLKLVPYRFVPVQLFDKIDGSTRGLSERDWVLIGRVVPKAIEELQSRLKEYSLRKLDPSSVEYYDFIRCIIATGKISVSTPKALLDSELLAQNRTFEISAAFYVAISCLMTPELIQCVLRDIKNNSLDIKLRLLAMNPLQCEGFVEMVEQRLRSYEDLTKTKNLAIDSLESLAGLPQELMAQKRSFLEQLKGKSQ